MFLVTFGLDTFAIIRRKRSDDVVQSRLQYQRHGTSVSMEELGGYLVDNALQRERSISALLQLDVVIPSNE